MRRRYQEGCLIQEKRKRGPAVWVFRWRDGRRNRKKIIGTVKQFKTKTAAKKILCDFALEPPPGVALCFVGADVRRL